MSSQERWFVVMKFQNGALAYQGDMALRGPVIRLGANPGPGGLKLEGYRGLDDRQAVLTAYDGAGETMQLIAELSGSRLPAPIVSNGTVLTLTFTSDSSVRFSGFELFASSLRANGTWPLISAPARPPDPRMPLPDRRGK